MFVAAILTFSLDSFAQEAGGSSTNPEPTSAKTESEKSETKSEDPAEKKAPQKDPAESGGPKPDEGEEDATADAPPESAEEKMLRLSNEAYQAFRDAQYVEAARLFEEAYALSPDPTLRKNQAIAWYEAGEFARAVDVANKFLLAKETQSSDRKEIRALLANAKIKLAAEALEADSISIATRLLDEVEAMELDAVARDRAAAMRVEVAKREAALEKRPAESQTEEPDSSKQSTDREVRVADVGLDEQTEGAPSREPNPYRVAGWAAIGTAAAGTVATLVYHLVALSWEAEFFEILEQGGDRQRFESLQRKLTVARTAVPIFYGVNVVVGGVGAYLVLRPPAPSSPEQTSERPGHVGIAIQGTFR